MSLLLALTLNPHPHPSPSPSTLPKVRVWNIKNMDGDTHGGSPRRSGIMRKMTFTEEFNGSTDGSGELVFNLPDTWPPDVPKSEFHVDAIEFSPCGNFLAVAVGYQVCTTTRNTTNKSDLM